MSQRIANGVARLELPAHTLPPFTHTNSYIIADQNEAILVDPGFNEESSLTTIKQAIQEVSVNHFKAIVLTHTHPDHIEGISLIRQLYPELPIYVHELELAKVSHYQNVKPLDMGNPFDVGTLELLPIFTPGHSPGHLSFYLPHAKIALVGDMVAGFGSIWIGTPEGNINDYLQSLETLAALDLVALAPGHGNVINDPYQKLNEVKEHRLQRLEQVRSALQINPLTLAALRQQIYPDLDARMEPLAERSLLSLLEKLEQDEEVYQESSKMSWQLKI
jgi:endoribonuclease LACTB2